MKSTWKESCIKAPVSVVILTLNEELNIENCLKSVCGWSDDVYVVDCHSNDSTVQLAKKFTKKIYEHERGHWAILRNWAIANLPLKYEWLLFVDADERLTEELKGEISNVLKNHPKECGFYINRRFYFMGRWLKHGDLYSKVLRLFKYESTRFVEDGAAEYAVVKGKLGSLEHDMIHDDKKSISRWIEKHIKYANWAAKKYLEKKNSLFNQKEKNSQIERKDTVWVKENIWEKVPLLLRPFLLFFYRYVLRFGFLDGIAGLVYHLLHGFWYRLLIYAKVKEMQIDK